MAGRSNFVQITPLLGVADLDASITFYRDILGFACHVNEGGYAYLERERIGIRLLEMENGAVSYNHIYIDVLDVDAAEAEIVPKLTEVMQDRWRTANDQPHGQREFMIRDPDNHSITIGQGIGENETQWDYRV